MSQPSAPAVVLARMNSNRLPGKVLRRVAGKPLIEYTLDRLDRCVAVSEVVVATSDQASDDPLVEYCAARSVRVVRGALDDVAARFISAARAVGSPWCFRANGDSPLLAVDLYGEAIGLATRGDIVSNVHPRSLPPGASVELVRIDALEGALSDMSEEEREHVTLHLYQNPSRYEVVSMKPREFRFAPDTRLVVDNAEDFIKFELMVERMARPAWSYGMQEVLDLSMAIGSAA